MAAKKKHFPKHETSVIPFPQRTYLVGIGSSAGGLEALSSLINALPSNLGISYVVIQHLSPSHRSMLVQLLGRETPMAVQEITDNLLPEPDVIYIAPSSRNTILMEGRFRLLEVKREISPKPSVNVFFASLAAEKTENAIGIILSGTGSDGTVGIREIKVNGGYTFTQEPSTAKYTGMPQSAIDSGCVDWILPPDKIAVEITRIAHNYSPVQIQSEQDQPTTVATQLKKLLINVKQHTRIDFGGYKEGTLWRRIERRISASHCASFDEYLTYTDNNPDELSRLSKDILISVTAFFRDPEAFIELKKVIRAIVKKKQIGDEIRFWVPACATGEEAYSLAILLAEELGENLCFYKIQIFATDIDNNAMNVARKATYIEGTLTEIDPALVAKYFVPVNGRYEVNRSLRDLVVFARQDLVLDPPFLRLDLVSCRNVLIYLKTDLQTKILAIFHYGLLEGCYLFLGKSESIFQQEQLFDVIDKTHRIYRRRPMEGRIPLSLTSSPLPHNTLPTALSKKTNIEQKLLETAIRAYLPTCILVNTSLDIMHIFGDVSQVLSISEGKPSINLMNLIRRELRPDLKLLAHQVEQQHDSVISRPRTITIGTTQHTIRLAIHPSEIGVPTAFLLVGFESVAEPPILDSTLADNIVAVETKHHIQTLEDELVTTRERLQTVIEELETSNEELQALNEEVQSSNEELQSTNEELEATNEELQSTNEELTTVNEELQVRSSELAETLNELQTFQNSVGFPIIAISDQLKIIRFNATAAALFSLKTTSIGKHCSSLRLPVGMQNFTESIQESISTEKIIEIGLSSVERHYLMHVAPYHSTQNGIRGVIVTLVDDTERRAAEVELLTSREKLLSIMNNSTAIVTLKDIAGRYEFVNRQFEKLFNVKAVDIIGKTDAQLLSTTIADDFRSKELEVLRKLQTIESEDYIQYGNVDLYMLSIRFPLIGADNLPYAICTQSSDITSRVQAESQLRLAARVFDRSSEGIIVTDPQKHILTVNEAFTTITGYQTEEVIGKVAKFLDSGLQDNAFYEDMWNSIHRIGWWQGEILNRRKSGELYPEWLTINAIHDAGGKISNYVCIFSDITIIKESQQRIEFLATHDALTELPNRLLFLDRVRQAVARGDRGKYLFAVMFIDLDDFKVVNDSLGHAAGDTLLKEVSNRMRHMVRTVDTVARFGGDEFALLLEGTTVTEVEGMARRICAVVGRSIQIDDQVAHVGASVGIAVFPHDSQDAETLLKHADTAMYEAKAKGKSAYQFFTQSMMEQANKRLQLENGLRSAIDNNHLFLEYQPQIDLTTGKLIGVECLLRWSAPEQGLIPPIQFISLAEKCGLIEKLGEWVADAAFAQTKQWLADGHNLPHVSINVSVEQFRRGRVLQMMERLSTHYKLPPEHIMLEITESTLAEDNQSVLKTLQDLKALGFKISIDDFGTGYSSLARLKQYPIDELKIDQSFVNDITQDNQDRVIAQTIIAMGRTLGFSVVAEGVESPAQLELLRNLDCDIVQGFLISKPLHADDFIALLADETTKWIHC